MTKPIQKREAAYLTRQIKEKALEIGFDKVGVRQARKLEEPNGLKAWLAESRHGEMSWMAENPDRRLDPREILGPAQSVISLALNYYTPFAHSELPQHGRISRYAWGRDYHLVLKEKLAGLARWILESEPDARLLHYTDTGPIMEKAWAHQSGVGWIGKHSNLITRELGSWVFLAEILTNLQLEADAESRNYCGTCHRCIDFCPTGAIVAPYVVDARRCISYLTIELRGPIPRDLRPWIGSRIFGCDDCQDICPWNRFAQPSRELELYPGPGNQIPILAELMRMTKEQFQFRFRQSPIRRARYAGFLRNVAVALGNTRDPEALPVLQTALGHSEPLVRQHAAWALEQIGGEQAQIILLKALDAEMDSAVREEILLALGSKENSRDSRDAPQPCHP